MFLIHQNTIRIFERIAHTFMQIGNFLLPVLAADKAVNKLYRPRAVQRHHGDDVFEMRRLERPQIAFHARRLKLEHACRVAALEQLIRLFIIKRQ